MKKAEMIAKYGLEWYENQLQKHREWLAKNKQHCSDYSKQWRNELKKQGIQVDKEYYWKDQIHRAKYLIKSYRQKDKKYNCGECTITVDEFLEICSNGCTYCGETDWKVLGLDRIDNSKPHTKDNCVCSCWSCNDKRQRNEIKIPILQYTKDGEFIKEWDSSYDVEKELGYSTSSILSCCNHKPNFKTAYGYRWEFKNQP